jgi:hypothetical protein
MPFPDLPMLAEAGGWVISIATLLSLLWLVVRGDFVPGYIHRREMERGDALDEAVDKLTEASKEQTAVMRTLLALTERDRA